MARVLKAKKFRDDEYDKSQPNKKRYCAYINLCFFVNANHIEQSDIQEIVVDSWTSKYEHFSWSEGLSDRKSTGDSDSKCYVLFYWTDDGSTP